MDGSSSDGPNRLVAYSVAATLDLAEIHTSTWLRWGQSQAEQYINLIVSEAQTAADNPSIGNPIEGYSHALTILVRWKKAKNGHYIVYRVTQRGIEVSRILHSAMDIERHLPGT